MSKYPTIKDILRSVLLDWERTADGEISAEFITKDAEFITKDNDGYSTLRVRRNPGRIFRRVTYAIYFSGCATDTKIGDGYRSEAEARNAAEDLLLKDFPNAEPMH